MNIAAYGKTDVGLVRSNNEDSFLVDRDRGLFIVADGMGGHKAGEVASRMTVDVISDHVRERILAGDPDHSSIVADAIRLANRSVHDAAGASLQYQGMGTTVEVALIKDDRLTIGHVGDSRIYLLRDNRLDQITNDHSLVAEQLKKGLISEEEARNSRMRNIITRSIGIGPDVEVDTAEFALAEKDIIILCSDGVTDLVPDDAILAQSLASSDHEDICNRLIMLANECGGKDNMTVVTVRLYNKVFSSVLGNLSKKLFMMKIL